MTGGSETKKGVEKVIAIAGMFAAFGAILLLIDEPGLTIVCCTFSSTFSLMAIWIIRARAGLTKQKIV